MKVGNLIELKKAIGQIINDDNPRRFPKVISLSRGLGHPTYRVTVEEVEEDFFIDSKGVKWVKAKVECEEQNWSANALQG